nr:hypothetical protein CFP56_48135 [Quercus suber]
MYENCAMYIMKIMEPISQLFVYENCGMYIVKIMEPFSQLFLVQRECQELLNAVPPRSVLISSNVTAMDLLCWRIHGPLPILCDHDSVMKVVVCIC